MRTTYFVYIMASRSGVLYTGVTSNLERRVHEHKHGTIIGFSKKYQTSILVYYEYTGDIESAILREKQIKGWLRIKKERLIQSMNPEWNDLSEIFIDSSLRSE